jgi:hypothetical protein
MDLDLNLNLENRLSKIIEYCKCNKIGGLKLYNYIIDTLHRHLVRYRYNYSKKLELIECIKYMNTNNECQERYNKIMTTFSLDKIRNITINDIENIRLVLIHIIVLEYENI